MTLFDLQREIHDLRKELLALSHDIHRRPEPGNREFYAVGRITRLLERMDWQVEKQAGGLKTAFVASPKGRKDRPAVGFLVEYDALPEIGHGCGHNLISAAGVGAALALDRILPPEAGRICLVGTPAEETTGGKITLLRAGVFDGLDAVLMFHPGTDNVINLASLALEALEVAYYGESGHCTILNTAQGDSLEALLQLFNWVSAWKKAAPKNSYLHGVIREGGTVPNIRPARTTARFYLRTDREEKLERLVRRFCQAAQDIAHNTKTQVEIRTFEERYLPFCTNVVLGRIFGQALKGLGLDYSNDVFISMGSMDLGNVSQAVPCIHPYLTVEGSPAMLHTREFAQAAGGPWGDKLLIVAAQALSFTGHSFLTNEYVRRRVQEEHLKYFGAGTFRVSV